MQNKISIIGMSNLSQIIGSNSHNGWPGGTFNDVIEEKILLLIRSVQT